MNSATVAKFIDPVRDRELKPAFKWGQKSGVKAGFNLGSMNSATGSKATRVRGQTGEHRLHTGPKKADPPPPLLPLCLFISSSFEKSKKDVKYIMLISCERKSLCS
jgi:hypothetical protein